eukprot:366431-Chlamydomonas_euryale.AAC.11
MLSAMGSPNRGAAAMLSAMGSPNRGAAAMLSAMGSPNRGAAAMLGAMGSPNRGAAAMLSAMGTPNRGAAAMLNAHLNDGEGKNTTRAEVVAVDRQMQAHLARVRVQFVTTSMHGAWTEHGRATSGCFGRDRLNMSVGQKSDGVCKGMPGIPALCHNVPRVHVVA